MQSDAGKVVPPAVSVPLSPRPSAQDPARGGAVGKSCPASCNPGAGAEHGAVGCPSEQSPGDLGTRLTAMPRRCPKSQGTASLGRLGSRCGEERRLGSARPSDGRRFSTPPHGQCREATPTGVQASPLHSLPVRTWPLSGSGSMCIISFAARWPGVSALGHCTPGKTGVSRPPGVMESQGDSQEAHPSLCMDQEPGPNEPRDPRLAPCRGPI